MINGRDRGSRKPRRQCSSVRAGAAAGVHDARRRQTHDIKAVKQTAAESGLKMGQLAIPLRVALLGLPQSPSIDSVLEVLGRERVLERLAGVAAAGEY